MEFKPKEFKELLSNVGSADLFHIKGLVVEEFKSRDMEYKFTIEIKI